MDRRCGQGTLGSSMAWLATSLNDADMDKYQHAVYKEVLCDGDTYDDRVKNRQTLRAMAAAPGADPGYQEILSLEASLRNGETSEPARLIFHGASLALTQAGS